MSLLDEVAPGRAIDLRDGHRTWAHHRPAPPDRPTIVLLHGITASATINWHGVVPAFADDVGLVALDQRAHGRGSRARFSIDGCADDVVEVLDHLGVSEAIVLGFSMGGAVAQTLARHHASRVRGLVLFATADRFHVAPTQQRVYGWQSRLARAITLLPGPARTALEARALRGRPPALREAVLADIRRHQAGGVIRAAKALTRFRSSSWLGGIEVPTAVVVPTKDTSVPAARQRRLASAIPGATLTEVDAAHSTVVWEPERVVDALVDAVGGVDQRRHGSTPAADTPMTEVAIAARPRTTEPLTPSPDPASSLPP